MNIHLNFVFNLLIIFNLTVYLTWYLQFLFRDPFSLKTTLCNLEIHMRR